MHSVELTPDHFQGAISIERLEDGLKPWRLPHEELELFPSPENALIQRAENCSGVRLRFDTETTAAELIVDVGEAVNPVTGRDAFVFDAVVDGELLQSSLVRPGETRASFADQPRG